MSFVMTQMTDPVWKWMM